VETAAASCVAGSGYWAQERAYWQARKRACWWARDFFIYFLSINRDGRCKVSDSVNRLSETGQGNRLGYSRINRDLSKETVAFARFR
jgi:hypothetical protein